MPNVNRRHFRWERTWSVFPQCKHKNLQIKWLLLCMISSFWSKWRINFLLWVFPPQALHEQDQILTMINNLSTTEGPVQALVSRSLWFEPLVVWQFLHGDPLHQCLSVPILLLASLTHCFCKKLYVYVCWFSYIPNTSKDTLPVCFIDVTVCCAIKWWREGQYSKFSMNK